MSQQCMVANVISKPRRNVIRNVMTPSALEPLMTVLVDQLVAVMKSILKVTQVRLPQVTLHAIVDYTLPVLFKGHAWVVTSNSSVVVDAMRDVLFILNANGFPAFSVVPVDNE